MNKRLWIGLVLCALNRNALAKNPVVGGNEMYPKRNIIENAIKSEDHTTLVSAVKVAGLVETLQGEGPFTVFAPTNAAFDKLPSGTVDMLMKPENKAALAKVLTYHVVPGKIDAKYLLKQIRLGGGKTTLVTASGGKLTAWKKGKSLFLKDEKGGMAKITIANVFQSNGVIHVIDHVALPN